MPRDEAIHNFYRALMLPGFDLDALVPKRPAWMARAECRGMGPDLFYPARGTDVAPARAVCARCPVSTECATCAIEAGDERGIWGGLSGRQRRQRRHHAA